MPLLEKCELAVMFWAGTDPAVSLRMPLSLGLRYGQLGIAGDYDLTGAAKAWKTVAEAANFHIYTVFAAYTGESYSDLAAVRDSVGFVPAATREARVLRTLEVLAFAAEVGASAIATHIGCLPAERQSPGYVEVRDAVRRICDAAAEYGLKFALETGQETAGELLGFIAEVDRNNLGINFDPANMVLYGSGEPVDALKVLQPLVLSVHCKDGKGPRRAGELGTETPLGQGDVDWQRFFAQLESAGYAAPLAIEREEQDESQRLIDIEAGLRFLRASQLSGHESV